MRLWGWSGERGYNVVWNADGYCCFLLWRSGAAKVELGFGYLEMGADVEEFLCCCLYCCGSV
jgi:hypothetical protein